MSNASVSARFNFEVAHFMPSFPEGHPNRRIHGHSYVAEVFVSGPIDPTSGYVMDFDLLSAALRPVQEELDHRMLNDIAGLENPTSELIVRWIWRRLAPKLPLLSEIVLHRDSIGMRVHYRGDK